MFSDIVSNLKIAISMQTFCDTFEGKVKKWAFQISKLILTFKAQMIKLFQLIKMYSELLLFSFWPEDVIWSRYLHKDSQIVTVKVSCQVAN